MDIVAERQGMVCSVAVCPRRPVPTPCIAAKMENKMDEKRKWPNGRMLIVVLAVSHCISFPTLGSI